MDNPICFALDVDSYQRGLDLVSRLEDHVGAFKVGLEWYIRFGDVPKTKNPVVLDLKLHDIPETVERAVKAGGDLGVKFMTLHIQQHETLERAVKAAEQYKMTLLGVTVLTSMVEKDLQDLGQSDFTLRMEPSDAIGDRVQELAAFAWNCGLRGFVCSPNEVGTLHRKYDDSFFLVPGVRPVGSASGDQKRTGTPKQTIQDGANFIVVGRPIRDAIDPVQAARDILNEVQS